MNEWRIKNKIMVRNKEKPTNERQILNGNYTRKRWWECWMDEEM